MITEEVQVENDSMETTFRHEGLSIGHDYLRLEGATISRGELNPASLRLEHTLGRGSCSRVVKAIWTQKNSKPRPVALKQFPIKSEERKNMLANELKTLAKVDCECLVNLMGAFLEDNSVTMVLEFMDQGSLESLINKVKLSEQLVSAMTYQMLWGLSYLHFEKRIHRDLKPGNVLLNSSGHVKLADFGIASLGKEMSSTVIGTTLYMAPERLLRQKYGALSDVWSLGLVVWQSATGTFPFDDLTSVLDLIETIQEPGSIERLIARSTMSTDLCQIVQACMQITEGNRIPARLLLRSPWFETSCVRDLNDAVNIMKTFFVSESVED